MAKVSQLFYLAVVFVIYPLTTQASITLNATRLVFKESAGSASVEVSNLNNDEPALVQTWVENYAENNNADIPLMVTPSLAKVKPNGRQILRILGASNSLPKDKESVFWLNVQYIPTEQTNNSNAANKNQLQLAVRQKIKIFYRPSGLKADVNQAASSLLWSQYTQNNATYISLTNPTPYCVSFYDMKFQSNTKQHEVSGSGMLCSGESREFKAPALPYQSLRFLRINDYGGDESVTLSQ